MSIKIDKEKRFILNSWLDDEIKDTIKLVRIGMKVVANLENSTCNYTNSEIAEFLNISERTTKTAIKKLKEIGYIKNIDKKSGYELLGKISPEKKKEGEKGDAYTEVRLDLLGSKIDYKTKMLIIAIRSYANLPMTKDSLIAKRMNINIRYVRESKEEARALGFISYVEIEKDKFKYEIHDEKIANYENREKEIKQKEAGTIEKKRIKAPRATYKMKGNKKSKARKLVRISKEK